MNYKLIKILSDGQFHSGVALGKAIGLTRAAVWKHVAQLNDAGLVVESVKGKGYRLVDAIDMLNGEEIRQNLFSESGNRLRDVLVLASVDSTNDHLKKNLGSLPLGKWDICTAEQQTGGRARRGREWLSPFAQNLYMSLAFKLSGGFASLSGLSLAVGVTIVEVLEEVCGIRSSLKWPNDVLIDQEKLAGILIDVEGEQNGPVALVIGVGINVNMKQVQKDSISQPWTSLSLASGKYIDRQGLFIAIVGAMLRTIESFENEGFKGFVERWNLYDAFMGKSVVLKGYQEEIYGVYCGVDVNGSLLLDLAGGSRRAYSAGELSLREVK